LAVLLSSVTFLIIQKSGIEKFRRLRFYILFSVLIVVFFVGTAVTLFYQKKDSTNGRLLIWKVSSEMIKDKPVLGHGINTFQAKYMDYQSQYFENNRDSKY
jgi:O-antigen ligase